ncbi:DUF6194 family protein [Geodermatophilus sp. SYSU D00814]
MSAGRLSIDDVVGLVESLGGVLTLRPGPGDGSPEAAWGDLFFYYAPDGVLPRTQPFATVVTKDLPGEPAAGLDRPGAFRLNIAASAADSSRWTGRAPGEPAPDDTGPAVPDTVLAHPVYGHLGWVAVVDPGPRTAGAVADLLRAAHARARARRERRLAVRPQPPHLPPSGERSSEM